MTNWAESMRQTFEYYTVDAGTWKNKDRLEVVKSSSLTIDSESDTLGSATFDIVDILGEDYIRPYLVTVQNGITSKYPLGAYLIQTPSSNFDGKSRSTSADAYTPLIELKEGYPDLGYTIYKGENIMDIAYRLTREHCRAPVIKPQCTDVLTSDFVSNTDDTWLTFISDLISVANYQFGLDELGRITYLPKQNSASLQPVYTYNDDNSSILLPDVSMTHDLYGIPNTIEVVYSNDKNTYYATAINKDPNSPTSTINRGRQIKTRITDPTFVGNVTQAQVQDYANRKLKEASTIEYQVSYSHGYCPVRVGDGVLLNYTRADLRYVKAKVISQTINCSTGCSVSETATFVKNLWG